MFSSHDQKQHIIYSTVFFINATNKNDPEIDRLNSKVVEIAMQQSTWGQPLPMAWVPLEMQISKMKSMKVNLVTKAKLVEINRQNGDLTLSDTELNRYLKVQHSMGKIVYFKEPGLETFVIVQPSALVNVLRAFITDELFWPEDKELRQIHQNLSKYGKIYKQDLIKLWNQEQFKHLLPGNDIRDYVIKVLVRIDILIEPKRHGKSEVDVYLVPSMVTTAAPASLLDESTLVERAICLSYQLVKSTVPAALSFKLIGAALSIWPLKEGEGGRPCLFFKSAVLSIDDSNDLIIDIREQRVEVYLVNAVSRANISPDIAASTQECLTLSLRNALDFYHNCMGKEIKYVDMEKLYRIEVGEICQKGVCHLDLNHAEKKSSWRCERGRTHYTKHVMFWVFDKVHY